MTCLSAVIPFFILVHDTGQRQCLGLYAGEPRQHQRRALLFVYVATSPAGRACPTGKCPAERAAGGGKSAGVETRRHTTTIRDGRLPGGGRRILEHNYGAMDA